MHAVGLILRHTVGLRMFYLFANANPQIGKQVIKTAYPDYNRLVGHNLDRYTVPRNIFWHSKRVKLSPLLSREC